MVTYEMTLLKQFASYSEFINRPNFKHRFNAKHTDQEPLWFIYLNEVKEQFL